MIDLADLVRPRCIRNGWHLAGLILFHGGIGWVYLRIPWVLRRIVRRLGGAVFGHGIIRKLARFIQACALTHIFYIASLFTDHLDGALLVVLASALVISLAFERVLSSAEDRIVELVLDARSLGVKVDG